PTPEQRQALIDEFYIPYADGISQLVRDRLAAHGRVTIIDVHSYPLVPNRYELHADGPRPEICVGTDAIHTPDDLRDQVLDAMRATAPTGDVGLNSPFWGCYVPLEQYGTNDAVRAVMLEIRRDVVAHRLDALVHGVGVLVSTIDA
ncbi:N-formylglutamate amidohydrolase, partial [Nocardioides sp. GCM10030258]